MYNIYIDKNELFEAKIELEGASLTDTSARLVVETTDWNLLFQGEIDSSGNVSIPIKKLKSIFNEDTKGMLKLEVVADDTYFTPWEDEFSLSRSKSAVVEVKDKKKEVMKETQPKVSVKQKQPIKEEKGFVLTNSMSKDFLKSVIKNAYLSEKKKLTKGLVRETVSEFINKHNLTKQSKSELYGYIRENKEVIENGVRNIRV